MLKRIKFITKSYTQSTQGNFAILGSIVILVVILAVAVALDSASAINSKQKTQDKLDAATLNIARYLQDDGVSLDDVQTMFNNILSQEISTFNLDCTPVRISDGILKTSCSGTEKSSFTGVTRRAELPFKIASAATLTRTSTNMLEVTFAYDISASMETQRLIGPLEKALEDFTQHKTFDDNDNAVFSLIPFGGGVVFGPSFANLLSADVRGDFQGCFEPKPIRTQSDLLDLGPSNLQPIVRRSNIAGSGRPFCPDPKMSPRFFLETPADARGLIKNIISSQGTHSSEALVWGYRSLHPSMRGVFSRSHRNLPRNFDEDNKKVLILMTDGKPLTTGQLEGGRRLSVEERRQISARKFADTCRAIKAASDNIDVYTIGFGRAARSGGEDLREFLENCTKGDGVFVPATERNLISVISDILETISTNENIRLVR